MYNSPGWPFKTAPAARKPLRSPLGPLRRPAPWLRHGLRTAGHLILDAGAVWAAYRLAYWARFEWSWLVARIPFSGDAPGWDKYEGLLYAAVPVWLLLLRSNRLYTASYMGSTDRLLQILKSAALGATSMLAAAFLYERLAFSRVMLAGAFPIGAALLCAAHALALWLDDRLARLEAARPVLLVGGGSVAAVLKERILARHPGAAVREVASLPEQAELERKLDGDDWYEVIVLRSRESHERILAAAEACDARGVRFAMVPDLLEIRMGEVQMDHHLGLPAYRIKHASLTAANFAAKRVFDVVFSALLLLATSPLWLVLCALIKLDSPGPVLFAQKRYGRRRSVFLAYKFRTMVADAEKKIESVKGLNDTKGAFFKSKSDPRVTRVGKWIRRFSLDEFPQFLNVLLGDMSVVGPRPLALTTGEVEALERDFGETAKKRMNVLPGITGLWQVSGRSDVSSEQRFSLDLFYIEHWSMGLDLEIIVKTPAVMLFGKGAY
ncbi:MAG: sugar transferase [Elusimicrobiota bacterium]|nr:MAG: sugar transferase [Elusimicrobiota bacterium]